MIKRISSLLSESDYLYYKVVANGAARGLGSLLGFILSVLIGRSMSADQAGIFFYALAIVIFFSTIVRMGTDGTVVRFTSRAHAEINSVLIKSVLRKSIILALLLGSIVCFSLYALANNLAIDLLNNPTAAATFQNISPAIICIALITLLSMSLQGLHRVLASVAILSIGINALMICAMLLFRIDTPEYVARAYSACCVIVLIGSVVYWIGAYSQNRASPGTPNQNPQSGIEWKELYDSCIPLWTITVFNQATIWSSQLIAGAYVESAELAQLAVAQRTALLISFPLVAISSVVTPRFAALHSQNQHSELAKLVYSTIRSSIFIVIPLATVCLLFSEQLMAIFGAGFISGAVLLQILIVGQLINTITGPMNFLLVMSGNEKPYRKTVYFTGPISILAGLLLIPIFGVLGAAFSSLFASVLLNVALAIQVNRTLGINVLRVFGKRA